MEGLMDSGSNVLGYAAGLSAAFLITLISLGILLAPRWTMVYLIRADRAMRRLFYGGVVWNGFEKLLPRRGQFFIPGDVSVDSPEDVHAYLRSDRYWASNGPWIGRLWAIGAGGLSGYFLVVVFIRVVKAAL